MPDPQHNKTEGGLARLRLVARVVDSILALCIFDFALVLIPDCFSFLPSACGQVISESSLLWRVGFSIMNFVCHAALDAIPDDR